MGNLYYLRRNVKFSGQGMARFIAYPPPLCFPTGSVLYPHLLLPILAAILINRSLAYLKVFPYFSLYFKTKIIVTYTYMFETLFNKVGEKVSLTQEEKEITKTLFIPKKLRKKQYLLQQDEICKNIAFIEKGVLRSYTLNDAGVEQILQLALEGHWITDMYSFLSQEPAGYHIDAVEDSELLLISHKALEELYVSVPKFERYFRILGQNNILSLQRRLTGSLSYTAEDKYLQLLSYFPDVISRVPQHMIASFLGITRETLSRIRKQLLYKK